MKNNPQKKILRQDGFPIGAEMAKKRYSSAGTTTPFLKQLILTILLFAILPVSALATAPGGQVIYVGNENVTSGGYWTTDSDGNVTASTAGETPTDNYICYDAENNVLTLHNATIKNELEFNESIEGGTFISGSAIGVFNQSGNAELTISLVGTNTIANVSKGIFVLASSASTGSSNLTIQGDGSLNASASQTGIWVQSNGNNAALCVENAEVTASVDGAVKNGVLVQAKDGSDVSLTVNGGSLTASVNANIWFQFGTGVSGSGTPTVTVSNNAIVRANGGIANTSSTSIQYGTGSDSTGGIVFDGNSGTVYGDVTLQEDLEIGKGESLTIPQGASLNTNDKLTVNGGTLNGTPSGDVTYKVTGVSLSFNTLTLDVGESEILNATVQPDNATIKNVTWSSNNAYVATVDEYGNVTAVAVGEATITVTTEEGIFTATCTVTVAHSKLEHFKREEATCTEPGNIKYWQCKGCGKHFSDENATEEITEEETIIEATGHSYGEPVWSWSEDGKSCGVTFTCKNNPEHKETPEVSVTPAVKTPATCTETGVTTYTATVEFNGQTYTDTKDVTDIQATGHSYGEPVWSWSEDGKTCMVTFTCANDETHTESPEVTVTSEIKTPATCTETGVTTYTATVEFNGQTYTDTKDVADIPATGHDYENGYCTICGEKDPDYVAPEPEPEPEPTYYRVDLRPVEGATVILSADEVEEGGTLTFTIEIAEGYVADNLMVTVSQGIGKAVEVKPDEAGVYTVKDVDGLVTITVYGVTEEPATAIERVETLRIYAAEGILHVETPTRQRVTIVSMAGALIADGEQEGARIYRDLNAGVYIVRVGDYATKVRVE